MKLSFEDMASNKGECKNEYILPFQLDDEKEKLKDDDFMAQLEELDDDFLNEYRNRRIEEMRRAFDSL